MRHTPVKYALHLVAAFAALLIAGAFFNQARAAAALDHDVKLDHPVIAPGADRSLYLMVRLDAPRDRFRREETARPPVNLALVLDRSGSMEERGKLEYAKDSARLVVQQLDASDRLAVVEYDDLISVLWPSQRLDYDRREVLDRIARLTPRGATNLAGGMMRGVDEVSAHFRPGDLSRVMLLSDGLANQGVTDPRDIARLVRTARAEGIRISTIGLGIDYDEDLMQAIAENGGGRYYYVESPRQMARIFEQELETLVTTCARDIRIEVTPGSGIRGAEVISIGDPGQAGADIGDMYAGETQTVLIRLDLDPLEAGRNVDLGAVEIAYEDVPAKETRRVRVPLAVTVSNDEAEIVRAANSEVSVEAALVEAEHQHAKAIAAYEAGRMDEADTLMSSLAASVTAEADASGDERLRAKLEALNVEREQMEEAAAAPADRSAYLKATKQRLYAAKSGQRAGYLLDVGDEGLEVERLQQALVAGGYWNGPVDGIYTPELKQAVEAYQSAEGIRQDGVAGPSTLRNLGLY